MKVCILDSYHHKNEYFLRRAFSILEWTLTSFDDAEVVFSAATYVPIENYPNKKFIFGPHFSVFPNRETLKFNNIHKNAIYIQPSPQAADVWTKEFNYNTLPLKSFAFGVDTEKFCPSTAPPTDKNEVFIYYKNRAPWELNYVEGFLRSKGITYKIFNYSQRYDENDYLKHVQKSKYGIWLGRHESQGFALEEALSSNVPLLVWNTSRMSQEYGYEQAYQNVNSEMGCIPYWSEKCGEYFYNNLELNNTFDTFIKRIEENYYQPRNYVLNNLSIIVRTDALVKIITQFQEY